MLRYVPSLGSHTSDLASRHHHLTEKYNRLYNTNKDLMDYATIHTCEKGKEFGGVDLGCVNCKEGSFRQEGASQCFQCAEGLGAKEGSYFCTGNQDLPLLSCPHMHVVKGYNGTALPGTNCEQCDTSQNQYKIGNNIDLMCNTCPAGSTIDHRRLLLEDPREYGRCPKQPFMHQVNDMAMNSVNPCAMCEPGTVGVGAKCINCPIGEYTDEFGQTACKKCENPNSYAFLNGGGKTCQDSKWHIQQKSTGQNTYLSSLLHALDFSNDEGYESQLTPSSQEHWDSYTKTNNLKMCWKPRN